MNVFIQMILVLGAAATIEKQVQAQDLTFTNSASNATLVELYSSEGCSSCPPAEAWLGRLADSAELWHTIFPVAFHVDYWDNLGWPDRFARPAYTERQRTYASKLGQDSVYTPEFIVAGREWRGWFHGEELPTEQSSTKGTLTLHASSKGDNISASYDPSSAQKESHYILNVVLLGFNVVSDVKRGENGGRELKHDFVVLDFKSKPMSTADNKFESGDVLLKPSTDAAPGAVLAWISTGDVSVVQTAGGWLNRPAKH